MYRLFSFAALCCLLVSCASGDNPSIKNDLPTVRDLGAYNEKLFELVEANTELSARVIGIVEYPGFRANIIAVTCSPENRAEVTAFVTGGVHGNEPAGAAFTLGLIQALSAKTLAHENTAIDIIPMVNPWGWAHDSRFNYDGKDINRDFASFRTQEAGIIRDYVKGRSYDLALDHHEDPGASGVYIYQYGKSDDSTARAALSIVKEKGYPPRTGRQHDRTQGR
ncbi:MAG: DUF2817 domain-containing protein [Spirochaetales bacterium]|nr:DUF2817 domain-containing protein [Spirochaetales bacterium]